ncbi:glucokinase [Candidatus Woesearchaeota archaeon]|nr:glucokinase [Candidatus Woesearchaeota archaeon]
MNKQIVIPKENFDKNLYPRFILTADFGGTNSYLAVMAVKDNKNFDMLFKYSCLTSEIIHVEEILNRLLEEAKKDYDAEISIACFGVAGPVLERREYVKMTNADIEINASEIISKTNLKKVILVNDFEAVGYGLDMLDIEKDVVKLSHPGEDITKTWTATHTIAALGAGSGLGMTIAQYNKEMHLHTPFPCEGGHSDFAPYDQKELELVEFLKENALTKRDVHPELERVLTGKGMENIYRFLISREGAASSEITDMINTLKGVDKLKEIENNYGKDPLCKETIDMFISIYARTARMVALMSECYSGLYIVGRIAIQNLDRLREPSFMETFEKHDKRSDVLRKVPVYVVTNPNLGLFGCCNVAVNFFYIK